jgi:adenylate cyclase
MTIRSKTLLGIGVALVILFVVLFVTVRAILLTGFGRVEDDAVHRNVGRVLEALSSEIADLNSTVGDWAPWDDTYVFADDANEAYITDNLYDSTFATLRVNMMLFYNVTDQLVFEKGFDLVAEEEASVPGSLHDHMLSNDMLLSHLSAESSLAGFILLPEGPLLVASQPILHNDRVGPIGGTLIMGRYLDDVKIKQLEEQTRLSITMYRLDDPNLPNDFEEALTGLTEEAAASTDAQSSPIFIRPLSEEEIAGYSLLSDVYREPGLLLRVDMPRDVYAQGQVSLQALIISLLVVGVVSVALTLLLLERLVLARLATLVQSVEAIGASGDIAMRVSLPGTDELTDVATAINQMLQDLQDSLAREKQLRQEVQRLRIEIDRAKRQKQVKEIVETDFFQDLQMKARSMRSRRSGEQEELQEAPDEAGGEQSD